MSVQRLDDFLKQGSQQIGKHWTAFPSNAYVKVRGFREMYVRRARRLLRGTDVVDCLDIGRVQAFKPGAGHFGEFLKKYHARYHLYIECVFQPRFQAYLLRCGFTEVPYVKGAPSFYLMMDQPLQIIRAERPLPLLTPDGEEIPTPKKKERHPWKTRPKSASGN